MNDGFVKVAAASLDVRVADCNFNAQQCMDAIDRAEAVGVQILSLPELCITGYSCQELFNQEMLRQGAWTALERIAAHTAGKEVLTFVGLPCAHGGRLYNCAAAVQNGKILALIPKNHIPGYGEFYESRYFDSAPMGHDFIRDIPFDKQVLFVCRQLPEIMIGCEICEDLWAPWQPSENMALAGATVVVNLSASPATMGKGDYRRALVSGQSARLICGYVYACASCRESTQDGVFSGHNIIAENGNILAESTTMEPDFIISEIDVRAMAAERMRQGAYRGGHHHDFTVVNIDFKMRPHTLTRPVDPEPFIPAPEQYEKQLEEVLAIQSTGLARRLEHTHARTAVVGLSGGLDSTLALLVMVRAADRLGWERTRLHAITMPGYGTTTRTRSNAQTLAEILGVTFLEIPIGDAVKQHFKDIGLPEDDRSVTFENSQARERTQVLMDYANRFGGLVVGTGDLSELALGWATYNGDHMSMYAVNACVPKTLVRHLVRHEAWLGEDALKAVLLDVLDTPVSPELLPPKEGEIVQITEDVVGPYELHDFFLYQTVRSGHEPTKIFRLARVAFGQKYDDQTILKWLKTFYRRFFQQQFKRSCLPDGPKVGPVSLSPRSDWRMPSDGSGQLWQEQLERLEKTL